MVGRRVARLREKMQELHVDTFMVTHGENRRYISGFTGSAGVLFVTQSEALLATDFRYYEQTRLQAPDFELVRIQGRFEQLLPQVLADLGGERIAFESEDVSYDSYQTYQGCLPEKAELVPTKDTIRWLRAEKDAGEMELLDKAIAVTDEAITKIRAMLRPGMTEREVAWKLEQEMRFSGAGAPSFELIVAGGPAGAMAHARATDRPLQAGEPIVIDMGCRWEGYCSDLTRTLYLGEPDARFSEMYAIVLRAQEKAEEAIIPGMTGKDAHGIAHEVIDAAGYGQQFGHGLGHGVGLAIHELPVLGPLSDHILKPGMVFSVEPGIYIPGWGGIRIEDLASLGENGLTVLSRASKDPIVPVY